MSQQIPDYAAMRLKESRALENELDHEGVVVFEDELVTLHHASYQKYSRRISLQHVSVKAK